MLLLLLYAAGKEVMAKNPPGKTCADAIKLAGCKNDYCLKLCKQTYGDNIYVKGACLCEQRQPSPKHAPFA
ncbi:Uncharacterized protein TCM_025570 [Theobroma cacao]|uniref:Uncharacterized protein n=1 Tax=Theobroma cacao TaxID=3641 RepID=A0A061EZK8_THECC|nr:Uncharacterized protein TCM_025570 [Theobroma cacao]